MNMISDQLKDNVIEEIAKGLIDQGIAGLKPVIELLLNASMKIEREHFLKARSHERSEERTGYANGYKPKRLSTRFGDLELAVPQVRGLGFYPQSLEKGARSEKSLKLAIAEMYVQGVSTRRVQKITEQLCGLEVTPMQVSRVSKELDEQLELFRNRPLGEIIYLFFDAVYLKARHDRTVVDIAILWAYGITSAGKREILGVSTSLSEAEEHWKNFLQSLKGRGMKGVQLIISDDHIGLRKARKACYPGIPWQRCQFHLSQNAQAYAPKKSMKQEIAKTMREIYSSPSYDIAVELKHKAIENYQKRAPEFTQWLEVNADEAFTVYAFPTEHMVKLRTTNGIERSNREIKRRSKVVGVFPNKESALRLVTARLIEIHEDWLTERHYLDMDILKEVRR